MFETAAIVLALLCMSLTFGFGVVFALNPQKGLAIASHRIEQLPMVMSDRYIGTAFLLLGALIFGDFDMLTWFLAIVGLAGFVDTWIYARAGRPYMPHLIAGVLYGIAATLAYIAHTSNGAT